MVGLIKKKLHRPNFEEEFFSHYYLMKKTGKYSLIKGMGNYKMATALFTWETNGNMVSTYLIFWYLM